MAHSRVRVSGTYQAGMGASNPIEKGEMMSKYEGNITLFVTAESWHSEWKVNLNEIFDSSTDEDSFRDNLIVATETARDLYSEYNNELPVDLSEVYGVRIEGDGFPDIELDGNDWIGDTVKMVWFAFSVRNYNDQVEAYFCMVAENSWNWAVNPHDDASDIESWMDDHYHGSHYSTDDFAWEYFEDMGQIPEPGTAPYEVVDNNRSELWKALEDSGYASYSYGWGNDYVFCEN